MATREEVLAVINGPLQEYFLKNTNVLLAEAVENPVAPNDFILQIGVRSLQTENELASLGLGTFRVPDSIALPPPPDDPAAGPLLAPQQVPVPVSIKTFEIGEVRALKLITPVGPCPPGYSIGHPRMSAGTFGCLLQWSNEPDHRYILSNNHVLAASNRAVIGDQILQPGRDDGGTVSGSIAKLAAYEDLSYITSNVLDAAIARVESANDSPEDWPNLLTNVLPQLGAVTGITAPEKGMLVCKVGRSTELTYGRIEEPDVELVTANYGPGLGMLSFRNQIRTTGMAQDGDSGAVLIEASTNNIVGLLFAGSATATFFTPIETVLRVLAAKLGGGTLTPV